MDLQKIQMDTVDDLYHLLNIINEASLELIDEQIKSKKLNSNETRLLREEMENYMKDVAKTASLNMTVQNKDCSDVVDFDCEPFDEKLQEEVNQKEKELKDYIAEIVEMRKKIPQEMQLLIQEMTEKQASETDVNLETTVDIPGIQREEGPLPSEPDVPTLTEDYNDVMDILERLEKSIPRCISQYDDLQDLLQSMQRSSSSSAGAASASSSS
ncbi:hypothetical protein VTP01DRAFT_4860 [Rhizomucor pusillus]|uniref:uncharacterized protein n=1 Tax=Rhizomucor pusillus TaxID=4840 RepID=UPI003743DCB3